MVVTPSTLEGAVCVISSLFSFPSAIVVFVFVLVPTSSCRQGENMRDVVGHAFALDWVEVQERQQRQRSAVRETTKSSEDGNVDAHVLMQATRNRYHTKTSQLRKQMVRRAMRRAEAEESADARCECQISRGIGAWVIS
jgi:hypothetical protein